MQHEVARNPESLAFQLITLDILRNVFSRADSPSEFGGYFLQQLREFTGAQNIVLAQHLTHTEMEPYRIVASLPDRRRAEATGPLVAQLIVRARSSRKSAFWNSDSTDCPEAPILRELGYDAALAIPLWVGRRNVGTLLLLGLPEESKPDAMIEVFGTLGSVVASLLRNSIAFEELEAIVEQRTAALRASESRFRAITENTSTVTLIIDAQHECTYVSPSVKRVTGYDREEILGTGYVNVTHPDDREGLKQVLERAAVSPNQTIASRGSQVLHRDGHWIFMESLVTAMFDSPGVNGMVMIARDVTDRKRAEEQLAEATRLAEAANRAKSEFLANMSHEIRTPMTAILGYADILADNAVDDEGAAAVRTIKNNGVHLLQIINGILDLSKIEAGKLEVDKVVISPVRIVQKAVTLMRVRAESKGLQLTVRFAPSMPQTIVSDPTRLHQVLTNLIGNAVKFTKTGRVDVTVQVVAGANGRYRLQIGVADTGIGMTEEQIEVLFNPFEQADTSTSRRFGGTGLGLAISRRLVRMLGGDITVVSRPGVGSTFTVTVDAGALDGVNWHDPEAQLVSAARETENPASQVDSTLNCRVLLVEDGPDNQRLIQFLLEKAGAEVVLASNGRIAIDFVEEAQRENHTFDVILMDMQMPVLDGYEATRRLRDLGFSRPILALTAHAMAGDREKCLGAGCDEYLTKPIDRGKLIDTILRLLASAGV